MIYIFLLDYNRLNSDYNMFKSKILKKFFINYQYKIYIFLNLIMNYHLLFSIFC